jgi:hypothetical protein
MAAGTLPMWNAERGFGFIANDAVVRMCFSTSPRCYRQASIQTTFARAIG